MLIIILTHHVVSLLLPEATGFNNNPAYYQPLHLAILNGDWESTKAFLDNDPSALTVKITMLGQNALHVAAMGAQWKLVEKLVQLMPANMVIERDSDGHTCLHYVAVGESVDTAKALVAKNSSVTQVTDLKGYTPLIHCLISASCKEMTSYLVLNTIDDGSSCPFSGLPATDFFNFLTYTGFHGN
jgi:ankyrin repeat protein